MIIYEGLSLIDKKPIVVIMTGGKNGTSSNKKTGSMSQVYILRSDIPPVEAAKTGEDKAICGECPHRPSTGGSCYVNVGQGPRAVYQAYKKGSYTQEYPRIAGRGKSIRLGAYGDPGAVESWVWNALVREAKMWTGFTHQYNEELKDKCMASADSREEALSFQAKGWKTFRVKLPENELIPGEILCLNETAGIQCRDCGLCNGRGKKNIAINIHGLEHKIKKFKLWSIQ